MRKLTCHACGRTYDYDKDDLCPKCGCFNSPRDGSSTKLERDLLSRFEGVRQPAPRYVPQSRGAAVEGRHRHGTRIEDCEAKPKFRPAPPDPTRLAPGQTRPADRRRGKTQANNLSSLIIGGIVFLVWFLLQTVR